MNKCAITNQFALGILSAVVAVMLSGCKLGSTSTASSRSASIPAATHTVNMHVGLDDGRLSFFQMVGKYRTVVINDALGRREFRKFQFVDENSRRCTCLLPEGQAVLRCSRFEWEETFKQYQYPMTESETDRDLREAKENSRYFQQAKQAEQERMAQASTDAQTSSVDGMTPTERIFAEGRAAGERYREKIKSENSGGSSNDGMQRTPEANAPVIYECTNCGQTLSRSPDDIAPGSDVGGTCSKSSNGRHFWVRQSDFGQYFSHSHAY